MSSEQNKALVRRWYLEVFNQGKLEVADEICAADYRNDDPYAPPGGWGVGPAATKAVVSAYRTAFPDVTFTIEDQVAEGHQAATRWSARGTHTGPLPGLPATGRTAVVTGISIETIEHGQIVNSVVNFDMMGMLQQLGAIPGNG